MNKLILLLAIVLFSCKPAMSQNNPTLYPLTIDAFIGLLIDGPLKDTNYVHIKNIRPKRVFEVLILNGKDTLASRDTIGKWRIFNQEKALEYLYQGYMENQGFYRRLNKKLNP